MKAMLVIATKNGYAVAPYDGAIPPDFVETMRIANSIGTSYSYSGKTVVEALDAYFEPPEPEVKPAPEPTSQQPAEAPL